MLRFTTCSLLVGLLVAVSALPLDETTTELLKPTTTTKPITFEDVKNDKEIKFLIQELVDCLMQDPAWQDYRNNFEIGLREVMERKKFSDYTERVLLSIFVVRNANCPRVSSYKRSTAKPTQHNEVKAADQFNGAYVQKSSGKF